MTEYFVPSGRGESEYDEKRSRFLGYVMPVGSEDEAREFINSIKKKNYDARHNCWCYIIRGGAERYSDDGEPQGTAGIPMLEVFRKEEVSNVVCVVTRYFGGVLLGAGGLLRAYTRAAKEALDDAGISVVRKRLEFSLSCSYSSADRLRNFIPSAGGTVTGMDYGESVQIRVSVPERLQDDFPAQIYDYTSGAITAVLSGECFGAEQVGEKN